MTGVSALLALLLMTPQDKGSIAPSLKAEFKSISAQEWINPLHLRVPDDRTWILLFFKTRYSERADKASIRRQLEATVDRLNQLSRDRRDVMVVGLTEESKDEIKGFLEELKPRFAIGVRSLSRKAFRVETLPAIVLVKAGRVEGAVPIEHWESKLPPLPEDPSQAPVDELSIEELKDRVTRNPSDSSMADGEAGEALERLRLRLPAEEFLAYCDQIEHVPGAWGVWVSRVRYQKHLADPSVVEKLPFGTPASTAAAEWRGSREDPRWIPMRSFFDDFNARQDVSVESIVAEHREHLTEEPNDLLIRFWLAQAVRDRKDMTLLPALRSIYDAEPDAVIRGQILLGICELAPTGDPETLRFLDERSKTEHHFRTSATLEMVQHLVRKGLDQP